MDRLVEIKEDVFDIADRLREIDRDYYPVYNLTKKRYEVHNRSKRPTLQLVLPYDRLDYRTIVHTRRTRIERAKQLLRELDEANMLLEANEEKRRLEDFRYKSKALADYMQSGKAIPQYKDIW